MPKFDLPENSTFIKPSEWQEWKQCFAHFRTATKLNKEEEEIQVCSLIYAIGWKAEESFKSFVFSEGEDKMYDVDKVL